ncbi:MAG TPA: hypothetical protein VMX36_08080 [Sedimentisphaerales bacterium]|nr:hypothetical protein [Sedimentisphaerales bacterium]
MKRLLKNLVLKDLCPDGIWQMTDVMKSVLRYHISRLPNRKVSEDETRYPQSPASMRAFLVKFFVRHYLQTQNCLLDYMISQDFIETIRDRHIRILDIGSGPAVTSLAITDMLACVLRHLRDEGDRSGNKVIVEYTLNDISGFCLGTGQQMLTDYFRICARRSSQITHSQIFRLEKALPKNMNQLQRIKDKLGSYDIATLSYVVSPLNEDTSFKDLINGMLRIESLFSPNGRILILQDKFQPVIMRQISRALGISRQKEESTQEVYPKRNTNETYTYSYYCCLYPPAKKGSVPHIPAA